MTDQIGARNVTPNPRGRIPTNALLPVGFGRENDVFRQDPVFQNALMMINVIDEKVQRSNPLLEAGIDSAPFGGGNNSGKNIEREDLFDSGLFAIDIESDAHLEQRLLGGLLPGQQLSLR